MHYVYILKCNDNKLYTGCTNNLKNRLERHQKGHIPATKNKRPVELHCYFAFKDKYTAYNFEKYLKFGSGKAFQKRHLLQKTVYWKIDGFYNRGISSLFLLF